jgi:hypothetical protein
MPNENIFHKPFISHGQFKLWIQDNTLFAELSGHWNEEAALEFEQAFMAQAAHMPEEWGHLVYLNDWQLCVPEMMSIIERLVEWCLAHGLKRAANVYHPSVIKSSILNRMIVQQEGAFVRAVFDNDQKAAAWLTSEGFPTRISDNLSLEFYSDIKKPQSLSSRAGQITKN